MGVPTGHALTPAEHERLTQIIASTLDAVVSMDRYGAIVAWNPMAEEVFGWPATEAIGRFMHETILPRRHRAAHLAGLARYLKSGTTRILNQRIEIEARCIDPVVRSPSS